MSQALRKSIPWLAWIGLSAALFGYLFHAMNSDASSKTAFLPGHSTDGHYQIEMACTACHDNEAKDGVFTSEGVTNKACNQCHGEDLELASDSHPTRKFKNPENAIFLQHVNAMKCTACHGEHNLDRTQEMGVTIPENFCAHCHEVTLENRESHKDLEFNTCATSGCHNYHDNVALAPSFMVKRYGQPDHIVGAKVLKADALARWIAEGNEKRESLTAADADAPAQYLEEESAFEHWEGSAHALAGVNCMDCHSDPQGKQDWVAVPDLQSCQSCHNSEVTGFLKGKHGMRLAHEGLGPMVVTEARRPMKASATHESLSCNSCHSGHNYDRVFASQQACMQCHDDEHTRNYEKSHHFQLWQNEVNGHAPAGTGVSCATCHMPREQHGEHVIVNHNQSENLKPNEKMLQKVCMACHGMEFGLSALADRQLISNNFCGKPAKRHVGVEWAASEAIKDGDERATAIRSYLESLGGSPPSHGERHPPIDPPADSPDTNPNSNY